MTPEEEQRQAAQGQAMIKAVYDDGVAEINDRSYTFIKMKHKDRRKVFAYFTHVAKQVQDSDMSFLDSPEFEPVEAVINKSVTLDGSLLSVLGDDHWDKHPEDYIMFISTALQVISYPFMGAAPTA